MDCCFSELAYKDPIKHVGLVQRGHYHFIEFSLFFCLFFARSKGKLHKKYIRFLGVIRGVQNFTPVLKIHTPFGSGCMNFQHRLFNAKGAVIQPYQDDNFISM
jgi:hypothetical protein